MTKKKFVCDKMYGFCDKIDFNPDKNVVKRYRTRLLSAFKTNCRHWLINYIKKPC